MDAYKTPSIEPEFTGPPEPAVEADDSATSKDYPDMEPLEIMETRGIDPVLECLGIEEPLNHVDTPDREKIADIDQYIKSLIATRHIKATMGNFNKIFDEVVEEMGIDKETEPYAVIDRVSGVVKGWRDLGFITDPHEKRTIFMKLARMKDSRQMNKFIFQEMGRRSVWQ